MSRAALAPLLAVTFALGCPALDDAPDDEQASPVTGLADTEALDDDLPAPAPPAAIASQRAPDGMPSCGDGILDPGEQCDLGDANADDAACTTRCTRAVCGDGLVEAGVEQCDLGTGNGDAYGGCLPTCTFGPRCGDMVLQPDHEECDHGPEGGVACDAACHRAARRIFVTRDTFAGDLGGLDGADLACRLAAATAGLADPTRFRAWLSDDTGSPQSRLPARDGVPLVLLTGERVADDLAQLFAAGPQRGVDITEDREQLAPGKPVWTNTSFTGTAYDLEAHCDRWTSSAPELSPVRIGVASAAPTDLAQWQDLRAFTSWDLSSCANAWHLYCVES
jgi:hypothetical protein